jgi:hypothetical protein
MNREAEQHLTNAIGFVKRGTEFYRKAADEIIAAKQADTSLTFAAIDTQLDMYSGFTGKLVRWRESNSEDLPTPHSGQYATVKENLTTSTLKSAPMEEVEKILDKLPKERQQQIAAAAGHSYHKARVEHTERERNLTPVQRKEREANASTIDDFAARMTLPFAAASIVSLIEEATGKLRGLIEGNSASAEIEKAIATALIDLNREFQVFSAMAGVEEEVL